jgi:hypothetical protein
MAQIELLNPQNHNVSLPVAANQNISEWDGEDFFCGENPSHSLVGFGLFKGQFSGENISAAGPPLQLAAPVALPCPFSLGLNSATFLPNSDKTVSFSYYGQTQEPPYLVTAEVNATTGYCASSSSQSTTTTSCSQTAGAIGYWNPGFGYTADTSLSSKYFAYFQPGQYTIVAMDDWNQTFYAHFQVTPVPTIATSTSTECIMPSGSVNVTITETAGQTPCGCALADSNSYGSLYVSSDSRVGDYVCMRASLNDSPQVYLSIKDSAGSVVFSGSCVASGAPGAPSPTGDTCTAYWDTASPDPQGNTIGPGTYLLTASDYQGAVVLEANFTLSSS